MCAETKIAIFLMVVLVVCYVGYRLPTEIMYWRCKKGANKK